MLWGAGATARLGFPTTNAQADCLSKVAATETGRLSERVRLAFPKANRQEQRDIEDFLLEAYPADSGPTKYGDMRRAVA